MPGQTLLKQGSRKRSIILNNIFPGRECVNIIYNMHITLSIPINFRITAEILVSHSSAHRAMRRQIGSLAAAAVRCLTEKR